MSKRCVEKVVTVNRFGAQVGMESCRRYEDLPIAGLFADPEAYRASQALLKRHEDDPLPKTVTVPSDTSKSDDQQTLDRVIGMLRTSVNSATAILGDVSILIRLNQCDGAALKRLQTNMKHYADGDSPVQTNIAAPVISAVASLVTIDTNALVTDLIAADSKTWMMNKFTGGVKARVIERDTAGRPQTVSATYGVQGFVPVGAVRVTFARGLPECLYFGDNAENCKAANKDVVDAYRSGKYSK